LTLFGYLITKADLSRFGNDVKVTMTNVVKKLFFQ